MSSSLSLLLGLSPPKFVYVIDTTAPRLTAADVADALASLKDTPTAFVNAVACFTPRIFYDTVLNALADWHVSWADGCENWSGRNGDNQRWNDNLDGFLHGLKEIDEQRVPSSDSTPMVIAIERAERLCDHLPELIVPLSRLSDLARVPVTTIFISNVSWEDIRPSLGASPDPFHIDAQLWSKQATLERLKSSHLATSQSHPENLAYHNSLLPLYEHFAAMLYSTCAPFIHDPDELMYIAAARWPGFVQPVLDEHKRKCDMAAAQGDEGEVEITPPSEDTRIRLMRFFASSFTAALEQLYPRLIDANSWAHMNAPPSDLLTQPTVPSFPVPNTHTAEPPVRLPRIAKFVLLAAFLASTNPAKSDVRMFSRAPDERRRARRKGAGPRKSKSGQAKVSQRLLGPAPFTLDRLLAILAVLLREYDSDEDGPTLRGDHADASRVHVYATVTELADMRLLHRTVAMGALDSTTPSLRCGISYEFALGLAREMGVALNDLMWEPA